MRINTKAKGSRRERQAKKELEAQGYMVIKAGGSLGLFDLIAIPPLDTGLEHIKLIQVKGSKDGYVVPGEKKKIKKLRLWDFYFVDKEIWSYTDRKGKEIEIL